MGVLRAAAFTFSLVEQCVDVTELDQDLVHRLIDRIEIGNSYKDNGVKYQPIDVYFRFVDKIETGPFER